MAKPGHSTRTTLAEVRKREQGTASFKPAIQGIRALQSDDRSDHRILDIVRDGKAQAFTDPLHLDIRGQDITENLLEILGVADVEQAPRSRFRGPCPETGR